MADYDPTFGGKLIVGIGVQSDKDTEAGSYTYLYCKPAGVLPKVSKGYKREKFAGGGRVAPSFKNTGDGSNKQKIMTAWSPGLSDILFTSSGIGTSAVGAPVYVSLKQILMGSAAWTTIGAMCGMWKLTGKKSAGMWMLELDYDAIYEAEIADAPGSAPTVSGSFAPLLWKDFAAATLLNGDTSVKGIGSVDVEVNHNLATYPGNNGSEFPSDCIPTDPDVKLTLEMLLKNKLAYSQFVNSAQASGTIALPVSSHTITITTGEYMTYDPDAGDINKPSIAKLTVESIPDSPTAPLLAVA